MEDPLYKCKYIYKAYILQYVLYIHIKNSLGPIAPLQESNSEARREIRLNILLTIDLTYSFSNQ